MLIPFEQVYNFIVSNGRTIKGVLHLGAHNCEEKYDYNKYGIEDSKIIWIDGNETLVNNMKNKGVQNIYHALINDEEKDIEFKITNNGQSSSILDLGIHKDLYPHIVVTDTQIQKTIRLDTFFEKNSIDPTKYDFWNLDIQGTELNALKSAEKYLKHVNYIYTEANTKEIYKGCALLPEMDYYLAQHGFARLAFQEYENHGWGDAFYVRVAPTL
jgi:FkbM family methyltransferase